MAEITLAFAQSGTTNVMSLFAALAAMAIRAKLGVAPPVEAPLSVPVPKSRFQLSSPNPTIPGVMLDILGDGYGVAQDTAKQKFLQARILWIDGTANLDKMGSDAQCAALARQIAMTGFNTIVLDVKPIAGYVLFPSKIAPKMNEWKGKMIPPEFDPVKVMLREARANHLQIYTSMNCFSEGHRDFKVGPGYGNPAWQTMLYEPKYSVISILGGSFPVATIPGKMPTDGNTIGTYADKTNLPPPQDSFYCVTLNRQGIVIEALSGVGLRTVNIPNQGSLLIGSGDAANFLRAQCPVGAKMRFDSLPEFVPIADRPDEQIPLIVNPNNPDVQDYELSLVKELLTNYDVDGVIYDDRLRYGGLNADFSPVSEAAFERYLGRRISWPDDVYRWTLSPSLNRGIAAGPYYDAWLVWRAQVIRNFVARVQQTVKTTRPRAQFGVYAGSNYGDYPRFGHNWASPDAEAGFWFMTPEYAQTGTAPLLDFMISGCYYPTATIYDAMSQGIGIGFSVEGAGQFVNRMVKDQTWVYAGIDLSQFANNPDGLKNAIQAACGSTQGVMVFDLSHNIDPMWSVFRQAFDEPRVSPSSVPGLLSEVRKKRAQQDKSGKKEPPVPISSGGAGIGM